MAWHPLILSSLESYLPRAMILRLRGTNSGSSTGTLQPIPRLMPELRYQKSLRTSSSLLATFLVLHHGGVETSSNQDCQRISSTSSCLSSTAGNIGAVAYASRLLFLSVLCPSHRMRGMRTADSSPRTAQPWGRMPNRRLRETSMVVELFPAKDPQVRSS